MVFNPPLFAYVGWVDIGGSLAVLCSRAGAQTGLGGRGRGAGQPTRAGKSLLGMILNFLTFFGRLITNRKRVKMSLLDVNGRKWSRNRSSQDPGAGVASAEIPVPPPPYPAQP